MIKNVGVLLAAGLGSRFNQDKPKQFFEINGKEVISYGIDAFKKANNLDAFIVMLGKDEIESGEVESKFGVTTVMGGASRAESFQKALDYIYENFPDCEKVIFHEAARPLIKPVVFEKYFDLLDTYDFVETCRHITDSLGSYNDEIPKREDFFLIQAPEAYKLSMLKKYFDVNSEIYFAAYQLPKSAKGYKYFDAGVNIKLTFPEDYELLSYYLKEK